MAIGQYVDDFAHTSTFQECFIKLFNIHKRIINPLLRIRYLCQLYTQRYSVDVQKSEEMSGLQKVPPLFLFLLLIGIHVNANPIANNGTIENESRWLAHGLTEWQKCFFKDPSSEDLGHYFLTRLIKCWPTGM